MDEKQFEDLKNRLDMIVKLLALDKLSGKKVVDQVSALTQLGFRPSEIAIVLNRKAKDITSIQAKMKKSSGAK
jgi:Holliday junction resolvasome RuvABC DNA-binding subunit